MKKLKQYMIVFCLALFVTNCKVEPVELQAQQGDLFTTKGYHYREVVVDEMNYGIWYNIYDGGSIAVVNLTKDKLEVEKLKRERGAF